MYQEAGLKITEEVNLRPTLAETLGAIGTKPLSAIAEQHPGYESLLNRFQEQEEWIFNNFGVDVRDRRINDNCIYLLDNETFDSVFDIVNGHSSYENGEVVLGQCNYLDGIIILRDHGSIEDIQDTLYHERFHGYGFLEKEEFNGREIIHHGYKTDSGFLHLDEAIVRILNIQMIQHLYGKPIIKTKSNYSNEQYSQKFLEFFKILNEHEDYEYAIEDYLYWIYKGYFDGEFQIRETIAKKINPRIAEKVRLLDNLDQLEDINQKLRDKIYS